jgi:hypothetical protein
MRHSDDDNHDDRDYYNSDPEPDEVQVFLSDNSGVQHFEDWIPTKVPNHISSRPKVQPEATFGPQETTSLADGDVANDITPDPDLIIHGTNFDVLLAQDPVNARMLELIVENTINPQIVLYTKVNLVKLVAINKAKTSNLEDAELASMMTSVNLAQNDENATRQAQNNKERIMRDCIDQIHCLNKTWHLEDKVKATLSKILKTSHYNCCSAINKRKCDDLCGVLYAIVSDDHYKNVHDGILDSDMIDQATLTENLATSSSLRCNVKPPKAPSLPLKRICANVITHLSLLGGRPASASRFYTHNHASFDGFMDRLSKARDQSHTQYPERLGFLTDQQMEHGKWLYQVATGMETLDLERGAWRVALGRQKELQHAVMCRKSAHFPDTRKFDNSI